ncbi:MAG: DUF1460 domain-containing protein [Deltaproteobacteria bacterium]|nr:DUF1460 domain-containing protein [Deltaproteobacteria bacterium]
MMFPFSRRIFVPVVLLVIFCTGVSHARKPSLARLQDLVNKVTTGPLGQRNRAGFRLKLIGDPRSVDLLIPFLHSKEANVRASACWVLGLLGDQRARTSLLMALKDTNARVRATAVIALGRLVDGLGKRGKTGNEIKILLPLLDDPSRPVRLAAIRAFLEIGSRPAAAKLLRILGRADADGDVDLLKNTALALGSSGSGYAVAPLTKLLAHPDQHVRLAAALALTRLGSRVGGVELLSWLKDKKNPKHRLEAIKGLKHVPGGWAIRRLIRALEDEDIRIQLAAARELAERKIDAGVDTLLRLLDNEHPWVRQAADEALLDAGIRDDEREKRLSRLRGETPGRPKPFYVQSEAQIDAFLRKLYVERPSLADRLDRISERFLYTPYRRDPLGEGPKGKKDKDPLFRFDAVDCLTFVEETLALALSRDLYTARQRLQSIRYQNGIVSYKTRNHFPMSQWIPNNTKLGLLKDFTMKVGRNLAFRVTKVLGRSVWKAPAGWRWAKSLGPDALPRGKFSLSAIRPNDLIKLESRVPTGTLLFIIRKDRPELPYLISHVALIISNRGRLFVRHAAEQIYHRVVDSPLSDYLRRIEKYQKRPVMGINLQKVIDPFYRR